METTPRTQGSDHILVRIATTDAERAAIYRLRFDVYVGELGVAATDHQEGDLVGRQLRDQWDEHAYHCFATENGVIVASGRVNLRRDGPVECEDLLEMARFVPAFPDAVSTTSRLAIVPELRGSGLFTRMACAIYEFHRQCGVQFMFIDCHPTLVPVYERLGFRTYKTSLRHPKYVRVVPMVLVLDDLEYLQQIRSPYAAIARRYPSSTRARAMLLSLFPAASKWSGPTDVSRAVRRESSPRPRPPRRSGGSRGPAA